MYPGKSIRSFPVSNISTLKEWKLDLVELNSARIERQENAKRYARCTNRSLLYYTHIQGTNKNNIPGPVDSIDPIKRLERMKVYVILAEFELKI